MAIQKEIWVRDITEGFFPDDSFAAKAVNDDAYVEQGKKVHVPNAGSPSAVTKNRSIVPAAASARTDNDVDYSLDEYTTAPVVISNAETVELSYDKRQSIISQDRAQIRKSAHEGLLAAWAPAAAQCVVTTGSGAAAHQASETGNRKAIALADIKGLMVKFDKDDVPQEDRYLLLDADMYAELLSVLTETDKIGFFAAADVKKGVVGEIYGFKVMKRSDVLRYAVSTSEGVTTITGLATTAAATDCAAGLAWQAGCVRRALGEVKMFSKTDDPTYYGDLYSFLVRCGGKIGRYDKKGVYALVGITA